MFSLKYIALASTTLLILGCASTESRDPAMAGSIRGDCFDIRQVHSWYAIDNRHVYLKETGKSQFLLTLFSNCRGLKFAEVIALSNQTGRVCSNDFGSIVYRDAGSPVNCRIDGIERVESKEQAQALVKERQDQKATEDE